MRIRVTAIAVLMVVLALVITGCGGPKASPVSGTVTSEAGHAVANAVVKLGGQSTKTDGAGAFSFSEVKHGTHSLTVEIDGDVLVTQQVQVTQKLAALNIVITSTNWALRAPYTYNIEPSTTYPDSGGELTDGVYAAPRYQDQGWVGHLREDSRDITVDLGKVRPVQEIKANFLQESSVGISYPHEVSVAVSPDGSVWQEVGRQTFDPDEMDKTKGISVPAVFSDLAHEARYVRLTVAVGVWVFIDEIEVWGTYGVAP